MRSWARFSSQCLKILTLPSRRHRGVTTTKSALSTSRRSNPSSKASMTSSSATLTNSALLSQHTLTSWSCSFLRHRAVGLYRWWLCAFSNSWQRLDSSCPRRCGKSWFKLSHSASIRACLRTWWSKSILLSRCTRRRAQTPLKVTKKASASALARMRLRLNRACRNASFSSLSSILSKMH